MFLFYFFLWWPLPCFLLVFQRPSEDRCVFGWTPEENPHQCWVNEAQRWRPVPDRVRVTAPRRRVCRADGQTAVLGPASGDNHWLTARLLDLSNRLFNISNSFQISQKERTSCYERKCEKCNNWPSHSGCILKSTITTSLSTNVCLEEDFQSSAESVNVPAGFKNSLVFLYIYDDKITQRWYCEKKSRKEEKTKSWKNVLTTVSPSPEESQQLNRILSSYWRVCTWYHMGIL